MNHILVTQNNERKRESFMQKYKKNLKITIINFHRALVQSPSH